jgi:hypothetical protein
MNLLIINHKLLLLSSKTLSTLGISDAILSSLSTLFALLCGNTQHLPMQLLSGKL